MPNRVVVSRFESINGAETDIIHASLGMSTAIRAPSTNPDRFSGDELLLAKRLLPAIALRA
jgi:hypothetical protein